MPGRIRLSVPACLPESPDACLRWLRTPQIPTEDPADPLVILRDLPEREHEEFLRQYHQAVDAAHDPAGYWQLRRFLHVWNLTAIAAVQPGYYEELAAACAGTAPTVPVTDAIPDWDDRVADADDLPGRTEWPGAETDARPSGSSLRQPHRGHGGSRRLSRRPRFGPSRPAIRASGA